MVPGLRLGCRRDGDCVPRRTALGSRAGVCRSMSCAGAASRPAAAAWSGSNGGARTRAGLETRRRSAIRGVSSPPSGCSPDPGGLPTSRTLLSGHHQNGERYAPILICPLPARARSLRPVPRAWTERPSRGDSPMKITLAAMVTALTAAVVVLASASRELNVSQAHCPDRSKATRPRSRKANRACRAPNP
jgi:hypothetical protein